MTHRRSSVGGSVATTLLAATLILSGCGTSPAGPPRASAPATAAPATTAPATVAPSAAASTFDPDGYTPRTIAASVLMRQFDYDRKAPLDLHVINTRTQAGASIETVSYEAGGHTISAEIVAPSGHHGRVPGVVYAHGGALDPDAFLSDALAIVNHGAVAIMPDIPITMTGDPKVDVAYVVGVVTAERRALDILVARADVDAHRLAFVGHSWGAELAAIMTGVEPRLRAVAIVCGWSRMSTDMYDTATQEVGTPSLSEPDYLRQTTVLDGFRYVGIKGGREILIQYGRQDPNIPDAQRAELTAHATGHATRKDYDAGHDLVSAPAAAADRLAFLINSLR